MKKSALLFLIIFPCLVFAQNQGPQEWNYQGNTGPKYWGSLDREYKACGNGQYQSPIKIETKTSIKGQGDLSIHYQPEHAKLVRRNNNIYMYYMNDDNKSYVIFNGKKYYLRQMHFHIPAEHIINGKPYPMELHIVNMNPSNKALAIAVMFDENGKPNKMLQQLFSMRLPEINDTRNLGKLLINPKNIIPENDGYFTYQGSLTVPPCPEIVTWVIMDKPEHASPQQIAAFKRRVVEINARPIQPLHGRKVAYVNNKS